MKLISSLMILLATSLVAAASLEVPIRDLVVIDTGPVNHVFGYGLVVGLEGTGDSRQALFAQQSVKNMLRRLGVEMDGATFGTKNVAAVMVTSSLQPFGRAGDNIDVQVSAIGDAKSLAGGVLLQTTLQDASGAVRAVAQGAVSIGGFNVSGGGSTVQKNHVTVGRVPNGAALVDNVAGVVAPGGILSLRLLNPDYATAQRIVEAVREAFGTDQAEVMDPGRVTIAVPAGYQGREPFFVARLEQLRVRPDQRAQVVLNERTGTVVVGGNVRLLPVAIAHGGLRIEISSTPIVSQPGPFSGHSNASTVVVPDATVQATEEASQLSLLNPGDSVQDLVRMLNALQVTPRDLVAILQALKEAGALLADLEVM